MRYAIIGCGRISPNHIAAALENGMRTLRMCATDYVLNGVTSISEMVKVSFDV